MKSSLQASYSERDYWGKRARVETLFGVVQERAEDPAGFDEPGKVGYNTFVRTGMPLRWRPTFREFVG